MSTIPAPFRVGETVCLPVGIRIEKATVVAPVAPDGTIELRGESGRRFTGTARMWHRDSPVFRAYAAALLDHKRAVEAWEAAKAEQRGSDPLQIREARAVRDTWSEVVAAEAALGAESLAHRSGTKAA